MDVITRFAPSPTGFLHIGSARTALFSYLFAKHYGGKFLLRIEDTDRARSTNEAIEAIFSGMSWLDLQCDGDVVFQFARAKRHLEVANELLARDKAYKCFLTGDELEVLREESRKTGIPVQSKWRDTTIDDHPKNTEFVIRIKSPRIGKTEVKDLVQGSVIVQNNILDDLILVRSDGIPTYNLAVVVDDHDMKITHIIRGDDHLNNAFKQKVIYEAMNWEVPHFAHIPLIHGEDGAKLSKRHGALGIAEYHKMGYLPEAINNYLLRLGWSHGDDEIISREQAIKWFDLSSVGKAPSRMDFKKLNNLNGHYIRNSSNENLIKVINEHINIDNILLNKSLYLTKERAKTINELCSLSMIFMPLVDFSITEELQEKLKKIPEITREFAAIIRAEKIWTKDVLMELAKTFAESKNIKLGDLVTPFRIALTGTNASPSIFDIMEIIGKEESINRIEKFL